MYKLEVVQDGKPINKFMVEPKELVIKFVDSYNFYNQGGEDIYLTEDNGSPHLVKFKHPNGVRYTTYYTKFKEELLT